MIRYILLLFSISAVVRGGIIMATTSCPGYTSETSEFGAILYSRCNSGIPDDYMTGLGMFPANAIVSTYGTSYAWPNSETEIAQMGPGIWLFVRDGYALAELHWDFTVTINLPQGGSGFYAPCLFAYGFNVEYAASFGGVGTAGTAGGTPVRYDPCDSAIDPAWLRPFESGVPQLVEGRFFAESQGKGSHAEIHLSNLKVFDQQMNRPQGMIVAAVELTPRPDPLLVTPEPGTFALFAFAGVCIVARRLRRRRV